jgi:hypothetical protein
MGGGEPSVLVIACGALAHEIVALKRLNGWSSLDIQCLPPELHNRPEQIPAAVRAAIAAARSTYQQVFVAYADCGTGGRLDEVLREENVERLPGAHCYEFFATAAKFAQLADAEPGTFYLTDFLVRHFDRLVIEGLGLDRHPELRQDYFGNYRKLMYLVQSPDRELSAQAQAAASKLGLAYEEHLTGYGELASGLAAATALPEQPVTWEKTAWRR